jgi:hypothetical protein
MAEAILHVNDEQRPVCHVPTSVDIYGNRGGVVRIPGGLRAGGRSVKDAGGTPELIVPQAGDVQGFNHVDKADTFTAHRAVREADPSDYSALVLPGGVVNADELRIVLAQPEGRHPQRRGQLGGRRGPDLHERAQHPGGQP